MRPWKHLSLIFSLLFHVVLFFGLFSMSGRNGMKVDRFAVELVGLGPGGPASAGSGGNPDSPGMIPAGPPFPAASKASPSLRGGRSLRPNAPLIRSEPAPGREARKGPSPEPPAAAPAPSAPPGPAADPLLEAPLSTAQRPDGSEGGLEGGAGAGGGEAMATGIGGSAGGSASSIGQGFSFGMGEGGSGGGSFGSFAPMQPPRPAGRSNPKPRYPEAARFDGREGTALLRVTVLPSGKVGAAAVERSSGHADLDQSAIEAVTKWTFLPARRGDQPVATSVRIPVTFALDRP